MDETSNTHEYWIEQSVVVLQRWISAGILDADLLEWALGLLGTPLLEELEVLLETKDSRRGLPFRRRALIGALESWENIDSDKANTLWERLSGYLDRRLALPSRNVDLDDLQARFRLDEARMGLIKLLFLNQRFKSVDHFLENLSDGERQDAFLVACLGTTAPVSKYFRKTDLLRTSGILQYDGRSGIRVPHIGSYVMLEANLCYCLAGDTKGGLAGSFFAPPTKSSILLERFSVKPLETQLVQSLLQRELPSLILLHGEPGTGKTEYVRAVCESTGRQARFLDFDSSHNPRSQFDMLSLASGFLDPNTQILIVDEADGLLNTSSRVLDMGGIDKGILNGFLDRFAGKAIFISNSVASIEASTLRRFHFTLPFKAFSVGSRQKVWNELAAEKSVFSGEQVRALAVTYEANPAQIRNTFQISMDLKSNGASDADVLASARGILSTTQKLLWGTRPQNDNLGEEFDLEFLNLDVEALGLMDQLHLWKQDFDRGAPGMNLLFHGLPGTGKSHLARHLAHALGLPLSVKRASDLVSPYVGETEVNIRKAFEGAEEGVLVIDEADSFLLDRSMAVRSYERSQTNEILQAMETFRGLFIATTNFQKSFDQASFRRFTHKITFLPLASEQAERLARRLFPFEWSPSETSSLRRMTRMTAGDLAVVAKRLKYRSNVTSALVLEELRSEQAVKTGAAAQVGFES